MKMEEGIQRVQSMYSRGLQSKDSRLTTRHIYSALCSGRATLIQQQIDKGQKLSEWSYTVLPCVELISVPNYECPCVPENGCRILRTKYKLPQVITSIDNHLIEVTDITGADIGYSESTLSTYKYNKGAKYTSGNPKFIIHNEYGYITVKKMLKAIMIKGPFADVIAAALYPSLCECVECPCIDIMQITFPIDSRLETALIQLANNECILMFKQMSEDRNANATDDTDTGMTHSNKLG